MCANQFGPIISCALNPRRDGEVARSNWHLMPPPQVIYILRNPKDVLVSFYHFSKLFRGYKDPGSLQEFLEEFLSGNGMGVR